MNLLANFQYPSFPKVNPKIFASVNSMLVVDGQNEIDEIQHIEYQNLKEKHHEAKEIIEKEGFLIIRNALDTSMINSACSFLQDFIQERN